MGRWDRVTSKCYLASHVGHRYERNGDVTKVAFPLATGIGYIPKLTVRVRFPSSAPASFHPDANAVGKRWCQVEQLLHCDGRAAQTFRIEDGLEAG